jgi:hypothetical protein
MKVAKTVIKNDYVISYSKYSVDNLIDVDIDGVDLKDYPDFSDAYVTAATFKDTGVELTETELDELNDKSDIRYDLVYNWLF